ncbi:claudin-10-like [Arapaima gigas]
MENRAVLMYLEISCFVVCLSGWVLVCSTMPTEYWNYSTGDGAILSTASFYSNLWRDCVSDSTGVSDCKEFTSMLALELYIHACRALIIISIIFGFSGCTLALIGMKCTKVGGSDTIKARVTFSAGLNYLISGFCAMIAYCWYGNKLRSEFVDPNFMYDKYEFGAALFVGWGGSSLLIIAGFAFCYLASKEGLHSRYDGESDVHCRPIFRDAIFSCVTLGLPNLLHLLPCRSKLQHKPISSASSTSLSLREGSEDRRIRAKKTFSRMPSDSYV